MFYGAFVLAKKGPLAKVWLAAHWDKKLTKAHVFETDVESTVDSIISPKVKMALRTSGHLLLGVVRIYYRKQKYLISDLGEACAKIRMAFRPGIVDLPAEGGVASTDTITLPEIFHDFETAISDLGTLDMEEQFTVNPSRAREITMQDDHAATTSRGMFDEYGPGFGDFGGGMQEDIEVPRKATTFTDEKHDSSVSRLETDSTANGINLPANERGRASDFTLETQLPDRGDFAGEFLEDGFGLGDGGMADLGGMPSMVDITLGEGAVKEGGPLEEEDKETLMDVDQPPQQHTTGDHNQSGGADTTVVPVEGEGFVLEPVEVVGMKEKPKKRKRKLVVDTEKELTAADIRAQLMDYSDTIQPKCFPPPTKKALLWKDSAGCEQLFQKPTQSFLVGLLAKTVTRNYFTADIPGEVQDESLIDLDHNISDATGIEARRNATARDSTVAEVTAEEVIDLSTAAPRDEPSRFVDDLGLNDDVRPFDLEGGGDLVAPPGDLDLQEDASTSRVIPDMPDLSGRDISESQPEPQGVEQTEEFERRRWTKRTQQVFRMIDRGLVKTSTVDFCSLTQRCNRKQAASRFYTCLLLAKEGTISVEQEEAYGSITIEKGVKYAEAY